MPVTPQEQQDAIKLSHEITDLLQAKNLRNEINMGVLCGLVTTGAVLSMSKEDFLALMAGMYDVEIEFLNLTKVAH